MTSENAWEDAPPGTYPSAEAASSYGVPVYGGEAPPMPNQHVNPPACDRAPLLQQQPPQYAEPQYAEPQYAEPQYAQPQHVQPHAPSYVVHRDGGLAMGTEKEHWLMFVATFLFNVFGCCAARLCFNTLKGRLGSINGCAALTGINWAVNIYFSSSFYSSPREEEEEEAGDGSDVLESLRLVAAGVLFLVVICVRSWSRLAERT